VLCPRASLYNNIELVFALDTKFIAANKVCLICVVSCMLRDSFRNNFSVGTAVTANQINANDLSATLAQSQFNVITPEYELKADQIAPTEGVYNFGPADRVVWHEATPAYFYEGTNAQIRARLENYITTVMEHFAGRITVWDVVNEATSVDIFNGNDGVGPDRNTEWFQAVGSADYIDWAFNAAGC